MGVKIAGIMVYLAKLAGVIALDQVTYVVPG